MRIYHVFHMVGGKRWRASCIDRETAERYVSEACKRSGWKPEDFKIFNMPLYDRTTEELYP